MRVNHPNLQSLHDFFHEVDFSYLVLELAPAGDLFNWIVGNGKMSEDDTRYVMRQLLECLRYLVGIPPDFEDIHVNQILLTSLYSNIEVSSTGTSSLRIFTYITG